MQDVCVVPMEDRRQYLAAALVLNDAGHKKFDVLLADENKKEVNDFFREYLLQFFENTVIPKKWRYLDAIPCDTQGKKKKHTIQALFASTTDMEKSTAATPGFHGITGEKIVRITENELEAQVFIPASACFFDGHFPDFKIFPAVAQFGLVVYLADAYLLKAHNGAENRNAITDFSPEKIKRIKFSNKLLPDTLVRIDIKYDAEKKILQFVLAEEAEDAKRENVYSSGSFLCGDTQSESNGGIV
ncbi:MAG: hypothetical protein Ta2A_22820 [Treponemataceae bacterium]|nr:MAG: hypothetical protein Ta2A_22820 [Treponemataceae bacterium]